MPRARRWGNSFAAWTWSSRAGPWANCSRPPSSVFWIAAPTPTAGGRRPWFLYGPRPDTDWTGLDTLWAARGYRAESLGTEPVRYRKPLGAPERADMLRATRALGRPDESVMRDDYLLVDMTLARPEADAGNPPIERLRASYD